MSYTKSQKIRGTIATIGLALGASLVTTLPAHAVVCQPASGNSLYYDYAWIADDGNTCQSIYVRHLYQPSGIYYQYWTSWVGGSGNYYATPVRAELQYHTTSSY